MNMSYRASGRDLGAASLLQKAVVLLVACAPWWAFAQNRVQFQIPVQGADTALTTFAQQADIAVLFPYDAVSRITANELVGAYRVSEGLEILLGGTGLEAVLDDRGQLTIHVVDETQESSGMKRRRALSAFAALATASATNQSAQAQDTPEEVIVTGSRIVRRDLDAPSPILTVESEVFEQNSSVALETVLNQFPQFNPGATQFTTGDIQPTANSSPGASTLNMRGLGPSRSLVLLDGRRAQPVNAGMTVDVNTLPAAAISGVEVISGGAAATYGPDAMAGVVNFKLRRDFEGVDINYQTGTTAAGDGNETRADVLFGGNFGDGRGNAMFSVGYAQRDAAWQMNRDFFVDGFNDPGTPANYPRIDFPYYTPVASNLPSQEVVNQILGSTTNQSRNTLIYVNPLDGQAFRANGLGYTGPTTFPYKIRSHNGTLEQGSPRSYVSTPLTRYTAFGKAVYDVTDDVSIFAQGTFVSSNVATTLYPTAIVNFDAPRNPAMEPEELRLVLDSRSDPDANYDLSRVAYWMPNRNTSNETKLNEFIVGAEGDIFDSNWTWEAYSSYGQTTLLTTMENFIWLDRHQEFILQPNFGRGGSIVAQAANIGTQQTFTCTSGIPVFEPWILGPHGEVNYYNDFQLSTDCAEAITARMSQANVVEQRVTEANVQGKLADMRAGELRAAFGISTRMNRSAFEPDALFLAAAPAGGQTDVDEVYGEILVPVTGKLELEFGARYSDFTTGDFALDAKSYKSLFSWAPTEAMRFRGGWQRANRTPNVAELYSGPTSLGFTWTAGDACRADTTHPWGNLPSNPNRAQMQQLCAELIYKEGATPGNNRFDVDRDQFPFDGGSTSNVHTVLNIGNPRLQAEVADTYTLGMVWQASDRSLNFSVDLYEIEIANVVGNLGFLTAYEQCFNVNGVSNPTYSVANPYCQAIRRDPETGNAGSVEGGSFNLSQRHTSGVDISVSWSKDMLGGEFGITSSVNKLFTWKQPAAADPDSPLLEYAGYGDDFEYRLFTQFSYARGALRVGLNWRYLPEVINVARVQTPALTTQNTAAYNLFNLNGSWQFAQNLRLRGGVDNILDKEPPRVGINLAGNNPTNAMGVTNSNYDALGRRYYVGLAVSF